MQIAFIEKKVAISYEDFYLLRYLTNIMFTNFSTSTMSIDQNVYITVINFNMHRTTIDIDEQFYPISSTAEILISSMPTRWTNHSDTTSLIESISTNSSLESDIHLNHIELLPFQSLLLKVDPTKSKEHDK